MPEATVTLNVPDGVCSNLSYQWTQTSGPAVTLSNPTSPSPTFSSPPVVAPTTLTFQLVLAETVVVSTEVVPAEIPDTGIDMGADVPLSGVPDAPVTVDVAIDRAVDADLQEKLDVQVTVDAPAPDIRKLDVQRFDVRSDLPPAPPLGMFVNVTTQSGFADIVSRNGGVPKCFDILIEDIDGDGYQDIFLGDHVANRRLALGDGSGHFAEQTLPSWTAQSWGNSAFDFRNNGRTSIVQYWDTADFPVMENLGNRTFVAVPASQSIATHGNGEAWSDWNGDGNPDYAAVGLNGSNRFYAGTGPGTYSLVSGNYGVIGTAATMEATFYLADLTGDDFPDMLIQPLAGNSNIFSGSGLTTIFAQNTTPSRGGTASFTVMTDSGLSGMPGPAVALGDFDNDGDLDIFAMGEMPSSSATLGMRLYRNDGGHFTDVTSVAGFPTTTRTVSLYIGLYLQSVFVDFDGDGYLDILEVEETRDRLWHNQHDGTFVEVTGQYGFGTEPSGEGLVRFAVGDLDGDHVPDLAIIGNTWNLPCNVRLWQNGVRTDNGLAVKLVGRQIKNAVGSKIYLYERNDDGSNGTLAAYREVLVSTTHRAPLEQYFALQNGMHYNLSVRFWPSGTVVNYPNVAPSRVVVSEP
jgi:hypothetical protein